MSAPFARGIWDRAACGLLFLILFSSLGSPLAWTRVCKLHTTLTMLVRLCFIVSLARSHLGLVICIKP